MPTWTQVELSRWEESPRDRSAIALFRPAPTEPPFDVLRFEYPPDEDSVGFAIITLPSGNVVAFVDVIGNPETGTLLWRIGNVDPDALIAEVCAIGGLSDADVKWRFGTPIPYGSPAAAGPEESQKETP